MAKPGKLLKILIPVAIVAAGICIYAIMHAGEENTDDAAISSSVVAVSPKVSGYVTTLNITDNQQVKAGDVLLEIDPTDYQIAVDKAKAALQAAQSRFDASSNNLASTKVSAPSNLDAATAQVDSAKANWDQAARNLKRMQSLNDDARTRSQLDDAIAKEKTARGALADANAQLRIAQLVPTTVAAAQAGADELAAQVESAKADLAQVQQNLVNTKVIAPMDGRVTNRGVERGDFLQPGQQLFSLVGSDYWVVANFKETQLTNMKPGQKVDIHVDAFPKAKLTGKVGSVQAGTGSRFSAFPAENATGNFVKIIQRVPVKILLDPLPDNTLVLGPGMSVEPTVYTESK